MTVVPDCQGASRIQASKGGGGRGRGEGGEGEVRGEGVLHVVPAS